VADTIIDLANCIARAAPECADKAMQIADLAREFDRIPDRGAVQDAIEASLVDTDASEPRIQMTASAVVSAVNDPLKRLV
jgi:hypothetical protein